MRRAFSFSSTMAAAVSPVIPCLASAVPRSASETNGTPLDSSTWALDDTWEGMAALAWTPVRNDVVRTEIRTAPASAVPIEAPRLVTVFWMPPTSPLCSSDTAETVTAPSWEARAPMPSPARSIGQVTMFAPAPVSRPAIITTIPANSSRKPIRTTRRGDARGKSRGTPTAASSSVADSGSSRTPVAMADRPRTTDRKSGTAKNIPAWARYWKKKANRPPWRFRTRRMAGSSSAACPRSIRRRSHSTNPSSTTPPARISQMAGDRPSQRGASGLGLTRPHEPARSTP